MASQKKTCQEPGEVTKDLQVDFPNLYVGLSRTVGLESRPLYHFFFVKSFLIKFSIQSVTVRHGTEHWQVMALSLLP